MLNKTLLSFIFFAFTIATSFAQNGQEAKKLDNSTINEALMIKEEQQKIVDSIVKVQLKQQLAEAAGNMERTQALEAKIRQIAIDDSLRNIAQMKKLKELKKTTKGHPVALNQDTLFYIFTRTGSFNAKERANAISNKVKKLYEDPFYDADSLVMSENEGSYDLIYKKTDVIVSIGNLDGLWFGKSNALLAKEYINTIKKSIEAERQSHSLLNLLKRIGLVLVIICALVLMVMLINRIFRRITNFVSLNKQKYVEEIRPRNIKIITPEHLESVLLKLVSIVRIAVIILIIYLSLPLLFSLFPETEGWAGTLLHWILEPLSAAIKSITDYLPDLFKVLVIYFLFKYLIKGIRYLFYEIRYGRIQIRGFHADWAIPTFNILRFILYCFMLVIVFPFLPGSSSPAFQGVSVFLGILISLGSSSAITNIVAGLVITYMRPFRVGDRVKIGEVIGDVTEKTMLVTRIRTIKNEDITVPNSMVLSSSTVNYSSQTKLDKQGLIVHYTVTIGYDVPWARVYELLIHAAMKTTHILDTPAPFVLQTNLDDYSISYQINAYTKEANKQAVIYSNLLEHIQDVFKEANIEIMSPQYHVIRDGGKE